MTEQVHIKAQPLRLINLSQQIINAGGKGFNFDVDVKPLEGSYSVLYSFNTPEGLKTLKTSNVFQVGVVDYDVNHFVMFDGDSGKYYLETEKEIVKAPFKILLQKDLGESFYEMKASLIEIWPNRIVWNLTRPRILRA